MVPPPQPDSSIFPNHGTHSGRQGFIPPQGAYQSPLPGHPPLPSSYPPVGYPNQSQSVYAQPQPAGGPQQWTPQAPVASAQQVPASTYNPLAYGPMPGAYQSPVSPVSHGFPAERFHGINSQQPARGESPVASQRWSQPQPPPQSAQQFRPPLPPRSPMPFSSAGNNGYPTTGSNTIPGQQTGSPRPSSAIYHGPAQFDPAPSHFQPNPGYSQQTSQAVGVSSVAPSQYAVPTPHQDQTYQAPPANPSSQHHNPIQLPPQPPPLPLGYQVEIQKNQQASPQHPPYSYQPPTHRYDPPGQQAAQQSSGRTHSGAPQKSHSHRYSYPEPPLLSGRPPPALPPPKTPEDPYINQFRQAQPGHYAPPQSTSGMPNVQPQTMSQPNAWAPNPQQPGPLHAPPPQSNHQTQYLKASWDSASGFAPASIPQMHHQNVNLRTEGEIHAPSASHIVDPAHTQSAKFDQLSFYEQPAWTQSSSYPSGPPVGPQYSSQMMQQGSPPHGTVQPEPQQTKPSSHGPSNQDWQGLHQAGYNHDSQIHQGHLDNHATVVDHQADPNISAGQVASVNPSATQHSIQNQDDIYRPVSAPEYNQHHPLPPAVSRPAEPQFEQYSHAAHSAEPPSQVDSSGQTSISQNSQQVPEKETSSGNSLPQPIDIVTSQGRQQTPVSGIGASLLGAAGGLSISDWEHFGEPLHDDIDDKPEDSNHQAQSSGQATKDVFDHTLQPERPPSRPSFAVENHSPSPIHSLASSALAPAPLQPHQGDSYFNTDGRPSSPLKPGSYLPTPPSSGEPIVRSSGRTDSIVSLEGFSSVGESTQINRVINAWSQPAPEVSPEARHEAVNSSAPDTSFIIEDGLSSSQSHNPDAGATQSLISPPKGDFNSERVPAQSEARPSEPVSGPFVLDGGIISPPPNHAGAINTQKSKDSSPVLGQGAPEILSEQEIGLDPWYRESLARYASMLRKESQATTKEEKLQVFTDFLALECQQRGIPYDPASRADLDTNKEVLPSDNMVTGPGNDEGLISVKTEEASLAPSTLSGQGNDEGLISVKTEEALLAPSALSIQSHLQSQSQMQDSDDEQYSPGGRPLLRPLYMKQEVDLKKSPHGDSHAAEVKDSASGASSQTITLPEPDSPARNAPIVVESASASLDRPQAERLDSSISKASTDTGSLSWYDPPQNRPEAVKNSSQNSSQGYKPYDPPSQTAIKNFNEESTPRVSHDSTNTSTRRPSYTPYVSQERLGSAIGNSSITKSIPHSTRHNSHRPKASQETPATPRNTQHDETFLAEVQPGKATETSVRQGELEVGASLKMVLPRDRQLVRRQSEYVATIRTAMNAVSDDFNFADRLHRDWEAEARRLRKKLDVERQKRHEEQEAHTDQLFAEDQIGYADIKPMEEEFKRSESARKAQEDEEEYKDYTYKVFDPIYTKLQEQIKALMEQYMSCTNVLKTAVGGKGLLDQDNNRPDLAQVIDLLLELYTKIEVRHGKVLNAVLDRDRRYKKTVLQPLYAAGDISKMKELEKHFEEAEKRTTYEAAVKKEQRAKGLLHGIEESTTRMLAEDLDYMHLIARELGRVLDNVSASYNLARPDEASDLPKDLAFARKVLQMLTSVDVAIMRHSHTAELILNLAKYDVANASAKLANAGPDELTKLRDQKLKDDDQTEQALKQRIRAIEQDIKKAVDIIDDILRRLNSNSQGPRKGHSDDPEHAERIRQSLEAAKKRNSIQVMNSGGPV